MKEFKRESSPIEFKINLIPKTTSLKFEQNLSILSCEPSMYNSAGNAVIQ